PAIEPVGESRSNPEVFSELAERVGVGTAEEETDTLLRIAGRLPDPLGSELMERGSVTPPYGGAPIQFVDVFPLTSDRKVHLCPPELEAQAPGGFYSYRADPATERYPLALISPASEKTVSSMMGELRKGGGVVQMNPLEAKMPGLSHEDPVRVYNDLGEVHVPLAINKDI